MYYILLKCLIFLPWFSLPIFASNRPLADTKIDADLSVTSKFLFSFNQFHGQKNENSWFHNNKFFGGKQGGDNPDLETNFLGSWEIDNPNVGVNAMQLQLMPNDKVVWFDTTALGDSKLRISPAGQCPKSFENKAIEDCFAHAVEYDLQTSKVRPLKLESDPWCSSGVLAPNGDLVVVGGYNKGVRSIRIISPRANSEFKESVNVTAEDRWYPSTVVLEDGSYLILGGRNSFSYEILPPGTTLFEKRLIGLQFLSETCDQGRTRPTENNLYPFLFLLPDGNTLVFANNRSVVIHPKTGKFVRELPPLPGGSRNYPATGSAVLLPLDLTSNADNPEVQMLVCGGNSHEAFDQVDNVLGPKRFFAPALQDCGRISVTKKDAQWEIEGMPTPRLMGDMHILPNGEILIINGAKRGSAGWENAEDANMTPVLYSPNKPTGSRFKELLATNIPRMYHSTSAVLPDGRILVAGSNPHSSYTFNVKYITELRVEKFDPPYLDPALSKHAPIILREGSDKKLKYGKNFFVHIKLDVPEIDASILSIRMYPPPFTTHSFSMSQRQLILKIDEINNGMIKVMAPPSGKIAPPGYYLIFVLHRGIPSKGWWVQITY